MRNFWDTFVAEYRNTRKNFFGRLSNIITLLVWPFLSLLTCYYCYRSFDVSQLSEYGIHGFDDLFLFIVSGEIVYNCFWAMVQGAGQIQYDRKSGMLETIILSPADKLGFVYGRAFGGMIHNVWMFTVLCIVIFALYVPVSVLTVVKLIVLFGILIVSGTLFGGLITTVFLYSRDINFIFTLCDRPMNFLSGTSIPVLCFPFWLRFVSGIFPTAYLIDTFRSVTLSGYHTLFPFYGIFIIWAVLFVINKLLLERVLKKTRENNSLILY